MLIYWLNLNYKKGIYRSQGSIQRKSTSRHTKAAISYAMNSSLQLRRHSAFTKPSIADSALHQQTCNILVAWATHAKSGAAATTEDGG